MWGFFCAPWEASFFQAALAVPTPPVIPLPAQPSMFTENSAVTLSLKWQTNQTKNPYHVLMKMLACLQKQDQENVRIMLLKLFLKYDPSQEPWYIFSFKLFLHHCSGIIKGNEAKIHNYEYNSWRKCHVLCLL